MLVDDELDELIIACDTLVEAAPARGSERRVAVLRRAIGGEPVAAGRRPRRWRLGAAAAAVLAVAAGTAIVVRNGGERSASAAILEAADNLGELHSFETDVVITDLVPARSDDSSSPSAEPRLSSTTHGRFSNGAAELVSTGANGEVDSTKVIVDGYEYDIVGDATTRRTAQYDLWPRNYGPASRAVLALVMATTAPVSAGSEQISGADAVRFDIAMTPEAADTLGQLSPEALAWFELEYPYGVDRLSVWVADDLIIVQIEVHFPATDATGPEETRRTTFSNFNGDITVTAPPGPYVDGDD
jgi:hypothetical protein